jgi:uncharacterized repeat protein (TIGR03803 family)
MAIFMAPLPGVVQPVTERSQIHPGRRVYSTSRIGRNEDGAYCYGSLTEGKDGNLYGITYGGGTYGYGTIFKIAKTGTPFTVLRHLNGTTDGGSSQGDLVQATDGNFYGMCYSGGVNGNGTIFKITPTAARIQF